MLILFLLVNSANLLEGNCGPLSDTTSSGKLCWANMRRRSPTVCAVVIEDMSYFEPFRMTINHN